MIEGEVVESDGARVAFGVTSLVAIALLFFTFLRNYGKFECFYTLPVVDGCPTFQLKKPGKVVSTFEVNDKDIMKSVGLTLFWCAC